MPSKLVEIKNRWHKEHKETVQGKEYVIPAGGSIRMPRYEGVALMGACKGFQKWDGDPKDYPYAKALDMLDIPESGEMNVKEFRHPQTGELFLSQEALDASFRKEADQSMIQQLLEGLAKNQAQPTTERVKVYACSRCDFETTNKAAYLKHSESKHESDGSKPT
jgi:hypothetical protein